MILVDVEYAEAFYNHQGGFALSQIPSESQWVVQRVSHTDSRAFSLRQPNPPITHNDFHL